ncbi:MAG TPA: tetratricopeptide repeat protein [Sedimentisphaerales bacterium]|nr:tetratricopeptide repeat protein [Sedimentisphaerales bacterium]
MLTIKNFRKAVVLVLSAAIFAGSEPAAGARSKTGWGKSGSARRSGIRFEGGGRHDRPATLDGRQPSGSGAVTRHRSRFQSGRKATTGAMSMATGRPGRSRGKFEYRKPAPSRPRTTYRPYVGRYHQRYPSRYHRLYGHRGGFFFYFSLPYAGYYYDRYPYYYGPTYYQYYYGYRDGNSRYEYPTSKSYRQDEDIDADSQDKQLEAVAEAFRQGDYAQAVQLVKEALQDDPENPVLAFAYVQSLFANSQYQAAARALRAAVDKVDADSEGVFYLLGLYPDKDTLPEQIERLAGAADEQPENSDLQLLLGYELLGTGQHDRALEALKKAEYDAASRDAAHKLAEILAKARDSR